MVQFVREVWKVKFEVKPLSTCTSWSPKFIFKCLNWPNQGVYQVSKLRKMSVNFQKQISRNLSKLQVKQALSLSKKYMKDYVFILCFTVSWSFLCPEPPSFFKNTCTEKCYIFLFWCGPLAEICRSQILSQTIKYVYKFKSNPKKNLIGPSNLCTKFQVSSLSISWNM